jgi:crotonobetainyl-CoA:carnitine CoA-transferase CaiB-like acyl-CoA transferase
MQLATTSVAASLLSAAALASVRGDGVTPSTSVEARHVAVAFRSERYARVNAQPVGASFAPLSRFWRTADGWIRTHANYPWHEQRLLSVLGCAPGSEPSVVAPAIGAWRAVELETAIFDANGCAAAVREPDAWSADEQGDAVQREPLLTIERVGDAPARATQPAADAASGVRVLDLTRVVAGPVCTRTLAAHGADVLRLDSPALPELDQQLVDSNPGKRSAFVDFGTRDGRATLDRLLEAADVVVIGYRPGALTRFGLAPDALTAAHPGLVVVTLSAWGETTPWAGRRGFDSLVQAASGIARVEAGERDEPGVLPAQALDHATGYFAAAAALCALARQRREGGSWHARLALAHTAGHLLDAARNPESVSGDEANDDFSPYMVELERGDDVVTLVAPPGMLAGRALEWPGPPPVAGADRPEWRGM